MGLIVPCAGIVDTNVRRYIRGERLFVGFGTAANIDEFAFEIPLSDTPGYLPVADGVHQQVSRFACHPYTS
jgi:hypothetical protein